MDDQVQTRTAPHTRFRRTDAPEMGLGERQRHQANHYTNGENLDRTSGLRRFAARYGGLFHNK